MVGASTKRAQFARARFYAYSISGLEHDDEENALRPGRTHKRVCIRPRRHDDNGEQ